MSMIKVLSELSKNDRLIILSELADIKTNFKKIDVLNAFRNLRSVFNENMDDNQKKLFSFCEEKILNLRNVLGIEAMRTVSEADDKKEQDKDQEKIQAKNAEEFRKESEKRKKAEQEPLAKAIRSKGENQNDAAEKLDVDKSTISRIKTGERNPSFELLQKLKKAYGSGIVNQML